MGGWPQLKSARNENAISFSRSSLAHNWLIYGAVIVIRTLSHSEIILSLLIWPLAFFSSAAGLCARRSFGWRHCRGTHGAPSRWSKGQTKDTLFSKRIFRLISVGRTLSKRTIFLHPLQPWQSSFKANTRCYCDWWQIELKRKGECCPYLENELNQDQKSFYTLMPHEKIIA